VWEGALCYAMHTRCPSLVDCSVLSHHVVLLLCCRKADCGLSDSKLDV
jgi:hypothetical protein